MAPVPPDERAEDRLIARDDEQFLSLLGHELRNSLSPIVTAMYLMDLRGETATQRERAIVQRQVAHLVELTEDLLQMARIQSGRIELQRLPIEISTVIARALEMARPHLEARQHAPQTALPQRGLSVSGDPERLAQIFYQLLSNAAKCTPPEGSILIRGERDGEEAVVHVRDAGVGIPPEMLPHVFDLSRRQLPEPARVQVGLGLGLSIARSLVAMHGGTISAHSAGLGQGAEFVVRLPILRAGP